MAELMVPASPTEMIQRPDAPYDLADDEADEWRAIVGTMPADYFHRGQFPMLAQLCKHICNARRIGQLIQRTVKAKKLDRTEYRNLLIMQTVESAAIMKLSRSMRLTHQATPPRKQKDINYGPSPWADDDE